MAFGDLGFLDPMPQIRKESSCQTKIHQRKIGLVLDAADHPGRVAMP
jgi:hypothetical protein